jgi:hypothetical protein
MNRELTLQFVSLEFWKMGGKAFQNLSLAEYRLSAQSSSLPCSDGQTFINFIPERPEE